MCRSRWRRLLPAGYGLLAACTIPVSVAAQSPRPSNQPSIYLRVPQPTSRLVVKQKLDEILTSVVDPLREGEQKNLYAYRIAEGYSAFGYPAEAWDLLSRNATAREDALWILARDGHANVVSDILAVIPESDPKKCGLVERVAISLDSSSRAAATQLRARHGCLRPTPPAAVTPAPSPLSALDEVRVRVGLTCPGEISTRNDCWMDHLVMVSHFLRKTAGTSDFTSALHEVSKIPHRQLRARVLWLAMIGLSHAGDERAVDDIFSTIRALVSEGGAPTVTSELASGLPSYAVSVCLLDRTFKSKPRPVLAGRAFSPGFGGCNGPTFKTMVLSTALILHTGGRVDFAKKILDWYQDLLISNGDTDQPSSQVQAATGSIQATMVSDIVGLAIVHAYMNHMDVARGLLRRYAPEMETLAPHNAFSLAFLDLGEILPAAFRRFQSEQKSQSWLFACEWLRGSALKNDVGGVVQAARLLEARTAARCLTDAITMAAVNGLHLSEEVAGLVLTDNSPFRPITPRVWTLYAASLIAANFDALAQRAMIAGIEDGIVSYSDDIDEAEHRDDYNGALIILTTEMFIRGRGAFIRALLPQAPSDAARSLIVLRLAAALADQGLWKEVTTLNEWADVSRVPPTSEFGDPWKIISASYGHAGDMEMALELIQLGLVDLKHLTYVVSTWKNGGRIVGP